MDRPHFLHLATHPARHSFGLAGSGRAACDDAHAVIDTAMAGRQSAIALSPVGIAAANLSSVPMTLISVLPAPPAIIAHPCGADRAAQAG